MIEVNNVTYGYSRRAANVYTDFSLSLQPGRIYGLLGKNGTGKSTLLYLMSGLLRAQQGCVTFDGVNVTERRPEVLREMFIVPEEFELPAVTMQRYVEVNKSFYPNFSQEVLEACLADFELPLNVNLGSLSMGQKKKAYMSFALATCTRVLLMDEPTNGLDIPSKSSFRKVVARHMTDDRIFVISTHQVRDIDMLIDHVVMLDGSHILLNRSTADICAALRFEERPVGSDTSDALFVQPSLKGVSVIVPNDNPDMESALDLELLFSYAETGKLPQSLTN